MKKHIRNNPGPAATVILIILAMIVGYAALWAFGDYTPSSNNFEVVLIQLAAIAIVFAVAYTILKGIFHYARLHSRDEKELKFKDLPKNAPKPVNMPRSTH